jgi:hypothetical protein
VFFLAVAQLIAEIRIIETRKEINILLNLLITGVCSRKVQKNPEKANIN